MTNNFNDIIDCPYCNNIGVYEKVNPIINKNITCLCECISNNRSRFFVLKNIESEQFKIELDLLKKINEVLLNSAYFNLTKYIPERFLTK